ncbi:hypothetical protein EOPP23_09905 [Endozoicomonas sp. OPT23]|uniref:hypothetical protein n=1 Tax=Endozoicomonas sp. OPT23 TaxID=2072845 RepID=UPI00129A18B0|nr:hypothetical protein [Endozoicomonas sp. OPT23]MRI33296.1 hypothetical protein [Endozoicomonas sp. OPT23]
MESHLALATKDVYRFFAGLTEFEQVKLSFGYLFSGEPIREEEWQYSWVMFQPDEKLSPLLDWPKIATGIYHIKAKSEQGHSSDPCEVRIRSTCIEHILLRCNQLVESMEYHQIDCRLQSIESSTAR